MDRKQTIQDQQSALRSLANKLTLKARDSAAESKRKEPGDPQAEYLRGLAEGYYKAALELADVLKQYAGAPSGAPTAAAPSAPNAPAAAKAPAYESIPLNEVLSILEYGGINPRDVTENKDGTYLAIFSRWENTTDHERVEKMKVMDLRTVIIESGRTKDTADPFVHFAFKKS